MLDLGRPGQVLVADAYGRHQGDHKGEEIASRANVYAVHGPQQDNWFQRAKSSIRRFDRMSAAGLGVHGFEDDERRLARSEGGARIGKG